ncbi:chemotaxis protein CheW [Thermodesulfobacteriota bacterium]
MADSAPTTTSTGNPSSRAGKYLTFALANEEYGVGILKVKEIIGIMDITQVPDMPEYAKGVVNLRGRVIPIIDLRLKFNMPAKEYDARTCIIVVEIAGAESEILIGIVVDSVSEVLSVSEEDTEPPPDFGLLTEKANILGMAKAGDKVKILLDIDRVLSREELVALEEKS